MKYLSWAIFLGLLNGSVLAEVKDSAPGGFTVVNAVLVETTSEIAWQTAIDDIALWWNADHTVSGDASRLRISATTGGCFCEDFGGGAGVIHMSVTMVNPGVLLRLTGGLGPLGLMGVTGNMTWEFDDVEGGTEVTFTYAVGGYRPEGLDSIAGPVDGVLNEALLRLKTQAELSALETADGG